VSSTPAANISSACSTPAPRSNSRAVAHGTARSAAPGPSMAAAIGCSTRNAWSTTSLQSRSRAFSSSTMSHSFKNGMAFKSVRRSPAKDSAKDSISKHAATSCSETRRCSSYGRSSASPKSFSPSKQSTRKACESSANAFRLDAISRRWSSLARSLEIGVAINIIAEPDWDEERFRVVRDWCLDVPEVVNLSINTPYPGTETWLTGQHRLNTRDYRLFDIQHAVLPTKLPIAAFYRELLHTQRVLYRKHMTWWTVPTLARELAGNLVRGQTNFMRGIMNYNKVYNVEKMLPDRARPVHYELPVSPRPETNAPTARAAELYIHAHRGRRGRSIDDDTERFVDATRMGVSG